MEVLACRTCALGCVLVEEYQHQVHQDHQVHQEFNLGGRGWGACAMGVCKPPAKPGTAWNPGHAERTPGLLRGCGPRDHRLRLNNNASILINPGPAISTAAANAINARLNSYPPFAMENALFPCILAMATHIVMIIWSAPKRAKRPRR